MDGDRIAYLLHRFFNRCATSDEIQEMASGLETMQDEVWKNCLMKVWESYFPDEALSEEKSQRILKVILDSDKEKEIEEEPYGFIHKKRNRFWKMGMAAAAATVLILVLGYWSLRVSAVKENINEAVTPLVISDLKPGRERATLTLFDGTQVILDSANNGDLTTQGSATVIKLADGQLSYKGNGTKSSGSEQVLYNVISTPAGGVYQLELSDGTKVWLNAMTTLRFPAVFAGGQRRVELTGEGYFEVTSDATHPFFVHAGDMDIKVLGTHFNVKAYSNDPIYQTTLLEGKVEVSNEKDTVNIVPGQQARMNVKVKNIKKLNEVNVNEILAWKNGEFFFEETELKDALNTLSRWYNFDIVYDEEFASTFIYGSISRNKNLSDVIKILETGGIHFRMERIGNVNRLVVLR